jgi:chaperonin GroES
MKKQITTKSPLQPLGDRVLIKGVPKEDKKTAGGIIIPDSVKEDRSAKRGTVISVGKGKFEDGKLIPVALVPGDKVLYGWGDDITIDGVEYVLVRENEIMAIIK